MPYYLNNASSASAGINIPSVVIGSTVGDYIEIKAVANSGNPSNNYRVAGQQSGFSNFIEIRPASAALACGGSSVTFTTGYTQPAVGSIFTIRFTRASSTTWRCTLNGSVLGADLFNSNNCTLDAFFRFSSSTSEAFRGGIYYVAISTNGGASATRYYDPSSTSSGTVLSDTVNSANNGNQVGTWPANDSEWVFYSSGGASWAGTIGKTSLSSVTKSLSINTGQSLAPNKVTLTVSSKQQSISTGFVATNGKTSLTLSPKQEAINVGYINTLSKLGLALLQKQLSITVGANLPFTGVIGKTTYALNGKQLGLALGWSGGVNKRNLSPITKQLNIAAGWNSGVVKSTLPVVNKQESVLAGFVNAINEINIPVNGKPLNLQTGTSISYIGTINKGSLNVSGKPLNVVAGTSIPFVGLMQKTSLTLTGKQLGVVRGQVLDLQKQALNIVGKQLSLGEIVYPIVPIERIFTIKDGDRIHYFKQTTTVYVMKNN